MIWVRKTSGLHYDSTLLRDRNYRDGLSAPCSWDAPTDMELEPRTSLVLPPRPHLWHYRRHLDLP